MKLHFIQNFIFPRFFYGRIRILYFAFASLFGLLIVALFCVQVLNHDRYIELSTKNRVRCVLVEAPRGKILDRHGQVLADNRPQFDLVLIREELPKEKTKYVAFLSQFLGLPQKQIWKTLQRTASLPYLPAVLSRDVDLETVIKVEERNGDLPALHVRVHPTRFYVLGENLSHLLGTVGKIPKNEVELWQAKGVGLQEIIGRSGMERAMDSYLRGMVGGMQVQVNNRGYLDKVLGAREPLPGKDLKLSIDSKLQQKVAALLKGKKGAGVVLDIRTGEVLSCVSQPSFDPNVFVAGTNRKEIQSYFKDSHRPLFARAYKGLYSPGSLFKLIVALTYMKEKDPEWKERNVFCDGAFEIGDTRFRCWKRGGHGSVGIQEALKASCNVFFYEVGLELGPEKIQKMASRFGLGKKTGFLLGEARGFVPTPKWKKKKYRQNWYGGDTVNLSIGQGALLCTPLQMATLIGAIASEGLWRSPNLIYKEESTVRDLTDLAPYLKNLKEGMRQVVQEPGGTGRRAWVEEMPAAGKTGTVEVAVGRGKTIKHTWFAGFAPYENPEIAVVILVEEGQSGGVTAAPLAREIFKEYAKL